jgi:hypothetical protein
LKFPPVILTNLPATGRSVRLRAGLHFKKRQLAGALIALLLVVSPFALAVLVLLGRIW